jgi:hypothetical protein
MQFLTIIKAKIDPKFTYQKKMCFLYYEIIINFLETSKNICYENNFISDWQK